MLQNYPNYDKWNVINIYILEYANSPIMHKSLHIPNEIWKMLEPQVKDKVMKIKAKIKKKKEKSKLLALLS